MSKANLADPIFDIWDIEERARAMSHLIGAIEVRLQWVGAVSADEFEAMVGRAVGHAGLR